jgi:hypothetical protein
MVSHNIAVRGVGLSGVEQIQPVLLQMNDDDFPGGFLRDLAAIGKTPLSSAFALASSAATPVTLYQPVARVLHLAVVQLACESPGFPRLDPTKVVSAGLVIRRVPLAGGGPAAAWPWMRDSNGEFAWVQRDISVADDDPDATLRPQPRSGQPALDRLLAAQALSTAMTESTTPAFVAAPEVCNAAGRTLVYAVIPTASSEANTQQPPSLPQLDPGLLAQLLPTLLSPVKHHAPQADQKVDYHYMSDDFARAKGVTDFLTFSATLRMLYTAFGAFEGTPDGQALLEALNRHNVMVKTDSGSLVAQPMGAFFNDAARKLIDYDPNSDPAPAPTVTMPHTWDYLTTQDQANLIEVMRPILQRRGTASAPPEGRFQDATRLYRVRLFFRIKSESSGCPPVLVWSCYSNPFRIAAWYESSGRVVAPVPLPDPFDRNVLKNAKPTASFAVPPSLMNAMGGASLTGLSNGSAPAGNGGIGLAWICGFSIPLITICAFFVLNVFISLLNIVFFWIAFIKICIPFPAPTSKD